MAFIRRREWLVASCAAFGAVPALAGPVLATPASLQDAASQAQRNHRALVLLVSVPGCPWCKLVRESYLAPLQAEGQPVFEIDMTAGDKLAGFDGQPTTQARLAEQLRISVTPTVLFFGPRGKELAPRLRGVSSTDFYGAYLQERLDAANRAAA